MGILDALEAGQSGIAPKNRVEILLDAMTEEDRTELTRVLNDLRWGHSELTRAIQTAYTGQYDEAKQLKRTSVREWRAKKGLV